MVFGREKAVHRILRAIEERTLIGLSGKALTPIGAFAERVGLPLTLRIGRQDHVPGLGQRLRRAPRELFDRLDRTRGCRAQRRQAQG